MHLVMVVVGWWWWWWWGGSGVTDGGGVTDDGGGVGGGEIYCVHKVDCNLTCFKLRIASSAADASMGLAVDIAWYMVRGLFD